MGSGISGAVIRGGRGAVSFVSGRGFSSGSDGGNGGPAGDAGSPPAWARAMQRRQTMSQGLGAAWAEVTATSIYTTQPLEHTVEAVVLDWIGLAAVHGVRWYPSRPPIDELAYEMDCRGVRRKLVLKFD